MKKIFVLVFLLFVSGCHASGRELVEICSNNTLFSEEGFVFEQAFELYDFKHCKWYDERILNYLNCLANISDVQSLNHISPFTKKDQQLINHLQKMRGKEDFWLDCPSPGCFMIVTAAIAGVLGSLYCPTVLLQATFGSICEGTATYAGYYATGTLPREVNEAVAAVDGLKEKYRFYYHKLASTLLSFYEFSSKKSQIITLVEKLRVVLPKWQKRIAVMSQDPVFALQVIDPFASMVFKILEKKISPIGTPPPTEMGTPRRVNFEEASLLEPQGRDETE